ncbi:hypothetical protein BH24ACT21_BH24ACT21_07720 [soil metagenome]
MEPTFMEMFYWAILPALAQALAVFLGVFFSLLLVSKRLLSRDRRDPDIGARNASEIVRERYARGEISRREYEQMREDLGPEQTSTRADAGYQRTH